VKGDLGNRQLKGVSCNSKEVKPGFLFVAVKGTKADGNRFVPEALKRGATVVVTDSEETFRNLNPRRTAAVLVKDAREALAAAAAAFFGNPHKKLKILGVTGTNGKTSTAFLLYHGLNSLGQKCAVLGTVFSGPPGNLKRSERTTPSPVEFFKTLKEAVEAGCTYAVCEVSSHGLHQKRVWGVEFQGAVFTNLTVDHLDYHKNMYDYFLAKEQLFFQSKLGVVNCDDRWGTALLNLKAAFKGPVVGCGKKSREWKIEEVNPKGKVVLNRFGKRLEVEHGLKGSFNCYNAALAAVLLIELGFNPEEVKGAFKGVKVPGRMEEVAEGVFVDYAHTPDALEKALKAVKEFTKGKTVVVFGCGGNRDRSKRPMMGKVAAALADSVIVTSDNPRDEEPEKIIEEILKGVPEKLLPKVKVEPSREKAIEAALKEKGKEDSVLIAGKGHEEYQEVRGKKLPFSDREAVRRWYGRQRGG
jgi:UDP-N-acetylmuramoyl-L-alanyl-D-glutamate--2,6-diaminopimelate ligase